MERAKDKKPNERFKVSEEFHKKLQTPLDWNWSIFHCEKADGIEVPKSYYQRYLSSCSDFKVDTLIWDTNKYHSSTVELTVNSIFDLVIAISH
jgi:hypothetical protein